MSVSGKCFKCSITVNALSMRKFGPAKEKEETWPFSSKWNLDILQHILLNCQPSRSINR